MPAEIAPAWERFLATDSSRPAGLDIYDDIFNDGWLFPLQRKKELGAMIRMARGINARVVLEIGSDKGGGFYHWVKGLTAVELAIAIEVRGAPFAGAFRDAFPSVTFLSLEASSYDHDVVEKVRGFLAGDKIDCLFLDGDKSRISTDFDNYRPMVRPGGLLFIHDVTDDIEPRRFFLSLKDRYRTSVIYDPSEGLEAQARRARGEPSASAHEEWNRIWGGASCGVGVVHL